MSKYKILYESEHYWQFLDNESTEFETVDEAVKFFLSSWARDHDFRVITVVEWAAIEGTP